MKNFKKFLVVGTAVALMMSMAACGGTSTSTEKDETEGTTEVVETIDDEKNEKDVPTDESTDESDKKDKIEDTIKDDKVKDGEAAGNDELLNDIIEASEEKDREQEHHDWADASHADEDGRVVPDGGHSKIDEDSTVDTVKDQVSDLRNEHSDEKPDVPRKIVTDELTIILPDCYPTLVRK